MGQLFEHSQTWWKPLQEYPDGSYAIFRERNDHVEIVSDVVGSRIIWYYKDDELFIASTSQRRILFEGVPGRALA